MIHPKLSETLLNIVHDSKKYGVPELNFLFWEHADEKVKEFYLRDYKNDPVFKTFYEERYLAPDYDFESLAELPADTLGYQYYHHLVDNGLSYKLAAGYQALQEKVEAEGRINNMPDEIKYSTIRGFQEHDIWHPLTGFDTTGVGEIKLQAFTLAQTHKPYSAFWMSIITTQMAFLYPQMTDTMMSAIAEGWLLGKKAKNLMPVHWEELFDRPLAELRQEYNLV
jgi:ubiquinone biosynthesis protein COQ4